MSSKLGKERVALMGGPYIKHLAESDGIKVFFMNVNRVASEVNDVAGEIDDKKSYRSLIKSDGIYIF